MPNSLLDGLGSLMEAIETVPIPGAPIPVARDMAAVGLSFLGTALRQNHIRRLTERLMLVEHLTAECRVEVDISLNLLDDDQWEAANLFRSLRSRNSDGQQSTSGIRLPDPPAPSVWVPVSSIPRRRATPIDVRDERGTRLPRLTQYESSSMIAAGMYRLLTRVLASHPDAGRRSELRDFLTRLDEARWLVQTALYAIVGERAAPTRSTSRQSTPNTVGGHGRQYRDLAKGILRTYARTLNSYFGLLNVAVNDYLLVVAVDAERDEHLLRYDSPMYAEPERSGPRTFWRQIAGSPRKYHLEYQCEIPSNIRSYHVVAETDGSTQIEQMYLMTDSDRRLVLDIAEDIDAVAPLLEAERSVPTEENVNKLLELELQTTLGNLSQLVRRRRWEAERVEMEAAGSNLRSAVELAGVSTSGEARRTDNAEVRSALQRHPLLTGERLRAAAIEIVGQKLFMDLSAQNEPIGQRGHAHWRPTHGKDSIQAPRINVRCAITLTVATGVTRRTMLSYVMAVVLISYGLGCLLARSPWPFTGSADVPVEGTSAEGSIVLLLLIPGFLYAHLDLPPSNSILGYLTARTRLLAHVCIGSTAALCGSIAAGVSGGAFRLTLAVSVVLPIASAFLLVRHQQPRRAIDDTRAELPPWVRAVEGNQLGAIDARIFASDRQS